MGSQPQAPLPLRSAKAPRSRLAALAARADGWSVELSARPLRTLLALLGLNLGLAACFVAVGELIGDRAELFRELAPATWFSFAQLLMIAATAWAVHRRGAGRAVWHRSFFGLAAVVFLVFAFDEITQSAIFLGHALEHWFGLRATGGFHDLEAVLLALLFCGAALVLLPRALVLVRHPLAVGLLGVAALLGVTSQLLDSFAAPTSWEFVAEETLKLSAEAFFLAGFLVVLRDVLRRRASTAAEPRPAS